MRGVRAFFNNKSGRLGLFTWFLLQPILFSTLVTSVPTKAKRDSVTDLISGLVASFESAITASQTGISLLNQLLTPKQQSYTITQNSKDPIIRAANLAIVRSSFLYGSPIAGGPYYPSGVLGLAKDVKDVADIQLELTPELALTVLDAGKATVDSPKVSIVV
jgi:hypothetical protein